MLVEFLRPPGVGCNSYYSRSWNEESRAWIQKGVHRAHIMPGINWEATTTVYIYPGLGVHKIVLELSGHRWVAEHITNGN